MDRFTWKQRARYLFDNTISGGPVGLIIWLAAASAAVVTILSLLAHVSGLSPYDHLHQVIRSGTLHLLDPTALVETGGSASYFGIMLILTAVGLLVTSTLIGIITTGMHERITALREGRSLVPERDHTLILGWSAHVFPLISELVIANENRRDACIVILGDRPRTEMEDLIASRIPSASGTRIVCRSGDPMEITDLGIVSARTARSIIVLAPKDGHADTRALKTILAVLRHPRPDGSDHNVVVEFASHRNAHVAHVLAGGQLSSVLFEDIISRIVAQTCRQSGLSVVYQELFDFEGDELYFFSDQRTVGCTFREVAFGLPSSTAIGVVRASGETVLNPPPGERLGAGDQIIVIAEDDDSTHFDPNVPPPTVEPRMRRTEEAQSPHERILMLGFNHRGRRIIEQLDKYVPSGSTLTIVSDCQLDSQTFPRDDVLKNLKVVLQADDSSDRAVLDSFDLTRFNSVIILSYSDDLSAQAADARTLMSLVHVRDIADQEGVSIPVVTEMLDMRNRDLAARSSLDDFVVSDRISSLIMAQLSENPGLKPVFDELFSATGAEIYLRPISEYVPVGDPVDFATIMELGMERGHLPFGYVRSAVTGADDLGFGVRVNPPKSRRVTFAEGDRLIVLADDVSG